MEYGLIFILLAALGAFFMAFNNGANDVANAFASAVGSKAITMRQALFLAGTVVFLGAVLLGGTVAFKLVEGVVKPQAFENAETYVLAMLAVLFSAGIFVLISTLTGLPVSSSNAIVGAITGVALFVAGPESVNWAVYITIVIAWIASPFIAGFLAFALFKAIGGLIIGPGGPGTLLRVERWLPFWVALTLCGCLYGLFYWASHVYLPHVPQWQVALLCLLLVYPVYRGLRGFVRTWLQGAEDSIEGAENAFRKLQIFTSSYVAFGIGSNDVANSISPVVAISIVIHQNGIPESFTGAGMPFWILVLGGIGMAIGIGLLGGRVMRTLGENITKLTNSRGFVVDFSVASTILGASSLGIPVSTTQAATGAIVGVGFSGGQKSGVNLGVIAKIVAAWVVTPVVAALITIAVFAVIRFLVPFHAG